MEWILIAAIGQQGEMGLEGKLPWNHPEDLKFFKETTHQSPLIMGRKTFESLPGLLKNRPHLVLSSQPSAPHSSVCFFQNIQDIECWCLENHFQKAFVIGGSQIYKLLAPICSKIWITHFHHAFSADTFFPIELLNQRPILSQTPLVGASLRDYNATIIEYGPMDFSPSI